MDLRQKEGASVVGIDRKLARATQKASSFQRWGFLLFVFKSLHPPSDINAAACDYRKEGPAIQ
jgi:hypothetical protein